MTKRQYYRITWRGASATAIVGLSTLLLLALADATTNADARRALLSDANGLAWLGLSVAALLTVALVSARIRRAEDIAPWLIGLLIAVDLFGAHPGLGTVQAAGSPYPDWPIIKLVQDDSQTPFRVSSEGLLPADGNEGLIYHLEDVVGSTPLEFSLFNDINLAEQRHDITELQRFALLNVRYLFTKRTFPPNAPLKLLGSQGDVHLYLLNPDLLYPRAWMVYQAVTAPAGAIFKTVGDTDIRKIAVFPEGTQLQPMAGGASATVQSTEAPNGNLSIQTASDATGMLVVSLLPFPGWQATVDGKQTPILSANGAMSAVTVPSGSHTVTFRFDPPSFHAGLLVTLVSVAAIILALAWSLLSALLRRLRFPVARRAANSSGDDGPEAADGAAVKRPTTDVGATQGSTGDQ